ncbi:Putative zinc-finger [Psychrobacillus sp. OK028]|uniref:zf-HC2 domain-containing protein n=1 Tax=Psychrobacillus sp. OK028 TaxID=1884359 RepID=UPI00088C0D4D|nr:zf-HC2 domain-containing protein [Psychrobacillus sp. OK028]SDO21281.1 Putative zinc-finger [Psychrobacillus sp. OK028]
MKNECYIVHDLLPSYIDQLCSEESARFIEQHIATCEQCAELLNQMRVEFDVQEQPEINARIDQKKPFQKIAHFFNAQKNFRKFLSISFWVALLVTVGFFIYSLNVLSELNDEREEARVIEQQKQDIMEKTFLVLSAQANIDEMALQAVFQEYSGQLEYLAVFPIGNIDNVTYLQEGPKNFYPIDYSQAELVIGENGKITESIIPNDYDLGTVAMADDQWIVQFEYQESYLETIENAHQIKYYPQSIWTVFQLPIVFFIITMFIFGVWLIQKRITKPVENILD